MTRSAVVVWLALLIPVNSLAGQGRGGSDERHSTGTVAGWTALGAGAGFAVGAYLAVVFFDDAVNSDRKFWISATVGAAAGGIAGYLTGRHRTGKRASSAVKGNAFHDFRSVFHSQKVIQLPNPDWSQAIGRPVFARSDRGDGRPDQPHSYGVSSSLRARRACRPGQQDASDLGERTDPFAIEPSRCSTAKQVFLFP